MCRRTAIAYFQRCCFGSLEYWNQCHAASTSNQLPALLQRSEPNEFDLLISALLEGNRRGKGRLILERLVRRLQKCRYGIRQNNGKVVQAKCVYNRSLAINCITMSELVGDTSLVSVGQVSPASCWMEVFWPSPWSVELLSARLCAADAVSRTSPVVCTPCPNKQCEAPPVVSHPTLQQVRLVIDPRPHSV